MKKLLIIEGEAEVRGICREVAQAAGFDCFEAADGVTGCEIFFDERPDLVLLDPFVPRMDGRKILERIAEDREGRQVPKVLFTTHAETPADLPPGIEEFGVVAVVPKPFDERLFSQSFHDLLEGTLPSAHQEATGKATEGSPHAVGAPEATGKETASHHAVGAPAADRKEEISNRRATSIPFAPGGEKPAQLDIGIPQEHLAFEPGHGEIVTTDLRHAPRLNASDIEILDILNHSLAESKPENIEDPIDEIFEEITAFTKKPPRGPEGQAEEKRPEKTTVEQGSIVPFFLPRLLARLYREKRGGIVTLSREGISKTIHLEGGCIRHVESTLPGEMLDTILLRMEVLTEAQCRTVGGISPGKEREWGERLLRCGFIVRHDLRHYLELQRKLRLLELFAWDRGIYRIEGKPSPIESDLPLLRIPDLLLLCIRKCYDRTIIEKLFGFHPATRLLRTAETDRAHEEMTLSPLELAFLAQIDDRNTIEDIVTGSDLTLLQAYQFTATLFYLKFIAVEGAVDREAEGASAVIPASPPRPRPEEQRKGEGARSPKTASKETECEGRPVDQHTPLPRKRKGKKSAEEIFQQGLAYLEAEQYPLAAGTFRKAAQMAEEEATYHVYLGWATYKSDPHSEATRKKAKGMIKRGLLIDNRHPDGLYFMAVLFEREQEYDKALAYLDKALRIDPGKREALRLKRIVESRMSKKSKLSTLFSFRR